jgi:hypothetical protein
MLRSDDASLGDVCRGDVCGDVGKLTDRWPDENERVGVRGEKISTTSSARSFKPASLL